MIEQAGARKNFQWLLPRDSEEIKLFFCKLATRHCLEMYGERSSKLNEQEIELKATFSIGDVQRASKARQFSNDDEKFQALAMKVYTLAYLRAQAVFEQKRQLLTSMVQGFNRNGFEGVYGCIQFESRN
jgi:hypothetical protein